MMKANYHTHTARCGHAEGTDEEYVLAAIERGFDELGFSDHVPWPYKNGYVHPTVRMHISQMPEYLASVRALAEKYRLSEERKSKFARARALAAPDGD